MCVKKVTIIGLGFMGGSLGLALREKLPGIEVCGVARQKETIALARQKGAITVGTTDLKIGVRGADLIFLATPLVVMPYLCCQMKTYLKQGAIVTDLGSAKEKIVASLTEIMPTGVFFLGGHPMTGSEKQGIVAARADIFTNAVYILTPTAKTAKGVVEKLSDFLTHLGVQIVLLSPAEHDHKIAVVSHLPHLLANALVNTIDIFEEKKGDYFALGAGGLRDTTRIADSSGEMWADILLQNREALLCVLQEFRAVLDQYEAFLCQGENVGLKELLEKARQRKQKSHKLGIEGNL